MEMELTKIKDEETLLHVPRVITDIIDPGTWISTSTSKYLFY